MWSQMSMCWADLERTQKVGAGRLSFDLECSKIDDRRLCNTFTKPDRDGGWGTDSITLSYWTLMWEKTCGDVKGIAVGIFPPLGRRRERGHSSVVLRLSQFKERSLWIHGIEIKIFYVVGTDLFLTNRTLLWLSSWNRGRKRQDGRHTGTQMKPFVVGSRVPCWSLSQTFSLSISHNCCISKVMYEVQKKEMGRKS